MNNEIKFSFALSLDILQVVDKFKTHPSIIKIQDNVNNEIKFSFALSSLDEIKKCINKLNTAKPTTYGICHMALSICV